MRRLACAPFVLGLALALAGCQGDDHSGGGTTRGSPPPVAIAPDYWPTTGWQVATPESQGFAPGALDTLATDAATALPYYTSLMVIRNGWIVHESYHDTATVPGVTDTTRHVLYSVSKSVTSLVVGRAWTLGDLDNLDATVESTLPAGVVATLPAGDARRGITLRQALKMRSGLRWNESAWLLSFNNPMIRAAVGLEPACPKDGNATLAAGDSVLCAVLQQPLAWTPGTVWNYNTYDTYLVSAFFQHLTGQRLGDYAATELFTPMGITFDPATDWQQIPTPGTYTFGGAGLTLTTRDLGRIGLLALYNGEWDGTRLLSREWMDLSLAPQGTGQVATFDGSGTPAGSTTADIPYGMQWWRVTGPGLGGTPSISARGLGGQNVQVFRDKELVVVLTCDDAQLTGRDVAIQDFMQTHVLDRLTD